MTTKEFLVEADISEPTLRRWLKDGQPVPELLTAKEDWRGWRTWEPRHVDAVRRYKEQKILQRKQGRGSGAARKSGRRQREEGAGGVR
jgi:hypothetical protein